jgi:hypothetical protein
MGAAGPEMGGTLRLLLLLTTAAVHAVVTTADSKQVVCTYDMPHFHPFYVEEESRASGWMGDVGLTPPPQVPYLYSAPRMAEEEEGLAGKLTEKIFLTHKYASRLLV